MKEIQKNLNIAIVGAGIIGITNAVQLLEKKYNVTIYSKDNYYQTNSDAAIATWYIPDDNQPLLQQLCFDSLISLDALSYIPESGITRIPMIYYYKDENDFNKSAWAKASIKTAVKLTENFPEKTCLKDSNFKKMVLAYAPLIDVEIYRKFIFEKFLQLGGKLHIQKINALKELIDDYDVVINCAGWESKYLTPDPTVYPVRGQVEIIKLNQYIDMKEKISFNMRDMNGYVVFRPISKTCALGTTYQVYDSDNKPREKDREEICAKLKPFFPQVDTYKTYSQVGIRCGRPDVRIENELIRDHVGNEKLIVHCYGHGGCGYSASWASAKIVLEFCVEYAKKPIHEKIVCAKLYINYN